MTHTRSHVVLRTAAAALALVAGFAGTLAAQGRPRFPYGGRVDTRDAGHNDAGRYDNGRYDDGRYDDGRYDNGRYDNGDGGHGNNGRGQGSGRGGHNGNGNGYGYGNGTGNDHGDGRSNGTYDGRTTSGNGPWDVIRGRTNGGSLGGSGVLRWSGRVDAIEEIRIQGRRAESYTVRGGGAAGVRSSVAGGLPARDVYVQVRQLEGRGRVRVVEQPSARNGYTAVLRVEDPAGGTGFYNLEAIW